MYNLYKYSFTTPQINCSNCIARYLQALSNAGLLVFWDVSEPQSIYILNENTKLESEIEDIINNNGFKNIKKQKAEPQLSFNNYKNYILACIGLVTGFFIWFAPMFIVISSLAWQITAGISTLLTIFLGVPSYKNMFKSWSMDTLFSISSLVSLFISIVGCFVPGLPIMFEMPLMLFGFNRLGLAIRSSLTNVLTKEVYFKHIFSQKPEVFSYKKGDLLNFKADDLIPVDCKIINFTEGVYLNSSIIDGQSFKDNINEGDALLAGNCVKNGEITVEVQKNYADSYLNKLDCSIIRAQCNKKSDFEESITKWLKNFIIGTAILALVSGICVSLLFSPVLGIHTFLSVLVSACPCTIALINPIALKLAQKNLHSQGIEISNFRAIDNIAQIEKIFLDLTGTLTTGEFDVSLGEKYDDNFLPFAKKLEAERETKHPIRVALLDFLAKQQISTSNINIQGAKIGNARDLAIDYQGTEHRIYVQDSSKKTLGFFKLEDKLKPEARDLIDKLKKINEKATNKIAIQILSGAPNETVKEISKALHIDSQGGIINKAEYIDQFPNAIMIGDAQNDKIAMQKSKIGIYVSGAKISSELVGFYDVKVCNLAQIPIFIEYAKQVKKHIKQNMYISVIYNALMLVISSGALLSFGVMLPPILCAGLMLLQSLLVLLNSYRFNRSSPKDVVFSKDNVNNVDHLNMKISHNKYLLSF